MPVAPTARSLPALPLVFVLGLVSAAPAIADETRVVVVRAGNHDRRETPVRLELDGARVEEWLGQAQLPASRLRPAALMLSELQADGTMLEPVPAQLEVIRGEPPNSGWVRLTWILSGKTTAGTERRFRPVRPTSAGAERPPVSPWSFSDPHAGPLDLKNRDRSVFRYNTRPVSHPSYPPIQTRDAYLHPAYTPAGHLITGDFSPHHPHHRGFFLAYTKTQVGTHHPDFWNIQSGSGKVVFDRLDRAEVGPVMARIESRHRWEAKGGQTVLNERWEIEAYDIPGSPYWIFDLTATQQATDAALELLPYRYGGMAYRGPESFVRGPLDVLTSEGLGRLNGNEKPARWVDLTGPIADGSTEYGGAMILDHPTNVNHPTVARIHPILLPFFSYVPGHDVKVAIGSKAPTRFRYRVVIHDGRPDPERNQQLWHDYAEPPQVLLESAGPAR